MKMSLGCATAALVTAGIFADQYYWTSTGSGNWSDTTKWHKATMVESVAFPFRL